jgi:CheY-like chemotaxis protein
MALACPSCQQRLPVIEDQIIAPLELTCGGCRSPLRLSRTVRVELLAPASAQMKEASHSPQMKDLPDGFLDEHKVLVAVEGEATTEIIQEILSPVGLEVVTAANGRQALSVMTRYRPVAAIVDVGLPDLLGYQLVEMIRKDERFKPMAVILLASIYDKMRYKREPESLYGADDYIERHHLQDSLLIKLLPLIKQRTAGSAQFTPPVQTLAESLVSEPAPPPRPQAATRRSPPPPSASVRPEEEAELDRALEASFTEFSQPEPTLVQRAPAARPAARPTVGDPEEHEAAKRLSRIILSDIVLYNQKMVEEGIRKNTFEQLLKDELEEGRKLYESRVPPSIRTSTQYFQEAVLNFIRNKRASLGLS